MELQQPKSLWPTRMHSGEISSTARGLRRYTGKVIQMRGFRNHWPAKFKVMLMQYSKNGSWCCIRRKTRQNGPGRVTGVEGSKMWIIHLGHDRTVPKKDVIPFQSKKYPVNENELNNETGRMEDKSTSTQGLESEAPSRRLEAKSSTDQGLEDEAPGGLEGEPTSTQGLESEAPSRRL